VRVTEHESKLNGLEAPLDGTTAVVSVFASYLVKIESLLKESNDSGNLQ
jgi:hypothetical protein